MGKLLFSTSTELLRVELDTVVFIKADGNYSTITLLDKSEYTLTMQLGKIEDKIADFADDNRFVRIGRALIVNSDFVTMIHPTKQKMVLSDGRSFRFMLSASKESLKQLKEVMERSYNEEISS